MIACPSCGAPFTPSLPDQSFCDSCSGLHVPEESSPLKETHVGSYQLVHQLGAGRFSNSWLAELPDGAGVVLKLLRSYAPDPETVQRFVAESQRLAAPGTHDHTGVARILEAGVQIGGALFLVYESGGELTMADELRGRGRMLPARALDLCAQLCDGLQVLHDSGLRHFGIKPANVGLAKDEQGLESAVLLDAFTAHLLIHAGLRETGTLPLSTAAYLSPEEAAGAQSDGRADLYAIGVLLFQLISGRLPIMGTTSDDLLEAHKLQRALRLRDVGRRVPPGVEGLIARLLAKKPEDRFESAAAAAAALRAAAPTADEVPPLDASEDVEDPVPIATAESFEPEVVPPKPPVPDEPLEPGLEAALLGRHPESAAQPVSAVAAPHTAKTLGGAGWWPAAFPAWLTPVRAGAAALAAIAALVLAVSLGGNEGRKRKERKRPAAVAQAPAPKPAAPSPAAPVVFASEPTPEPAPEPPLPKAKKAAAPTPTPPRPPGTKSQLAEAQRALGGGRIKAAVQALDQVLAKPDLPPADQARATRMMGDAKAKLGDKAGAIDWYRKYLRLTKDADDRMRVVKLIGALNR